MTVEKGTSGQNFVELFSDQITRSSINIEDIDQTNPNDRFLVVQVLIRAAGMTQDQVNNLSLELANMEYREKDINKKALISDLQSFVYKLSNEEG